MAGGIAGSGVVNLKFVCYTGLPLTILGGQEKSSSIGPQVISSYSTLYGEL
jgi:hypothetical protein